MSPHRLKNILVHVHADYRLTGPALLFVFLFLFLVLFLVIHCCVIAEAQGSTDAVQTRPKQTAVASRRRGTWRVCGRTRSTPTSTVFCGSG